MLGAGGPARKVDVARPSTGRYAQRLNWRLEKWYESTEESMSFARRAAEGAPPGSRLGILGTCALNDIGGAGRYVHAAVPYGASPPHESRPRARRRGGRLP